MGYIGVMPRVVVLKVRVTWGGWKHERVHGFHLMWWDTWKSVLWLLHCGIWIV